MTFTQALKEAISILIWGICIGLAVASYMFIIWALIQIPFYWISIPSVGVLLIFTLAMIIWKVEN